MIDYALEGQKWGLATPGTSGGTVTWSLGGSVPASFGAVVSAAFADWAGRANIGFKQVSADANITFASAALDGPNNQLAVTDFSYRGPSMVSATITFDSAEGWRTSGSKVVSASGVNLFPVALHEIGHAIGLDHYNDVLAVMNSILASSLVDLTQSDVDGIRALYGAAPVSALTASASASFGTLVHDASQAGGKVFALFDGLLGRQPDALGLEHYAGAMAHGLSVRDVAQSILVSGERADHYGASDQLGSTAFVQQLYQSMLGRGADGGGLAHYEQLLASGTSRADVALDLALSSEHLGRMAGAFAAGIFVPDENTADAARLYYGVLGRAPDAAGLASHAKDLAAGQSIRDGAAGFLNSSEFKTKYGALDAAHFVETLYQNALGRPSDTAGLQHYLDDLQHGSSRADVASGIAESGEAHNHLLSVIETGWLTA